MAGVWCFRRNDTLGALAFCSYGAWWIGLVTFGLLFTSPRSSQVRSCELQYLPWRGGCSAYAK